MAFDEAMKSGFGMPCPGCQVVFRKDELCTHMSCSGCQTVWCYICGLSVEDCDKAPRRGEASSEPIYGHNEDWRNNPLRCPMYLSMIAEVDEDWNLDEGDGDSDDDFYYDDEADIENACVDKFHRWRTLQKLSTLRDELGEEKWQDLRRTFASVRDCGFTDQDIKNAGNAPLFVGPEPRTTKQQKTNNDDVVDLISIVSKIVALWYIGADVQFIIILMNVEYSSFWLVTKSIYCKRTPWTDSFAPFRMFSGYDS